MPNFGLMSGNPYYYGPSGLAAGVNAFAENLLNAYNTFSTVRQRDEALANEKKLMQIKLDEEERKRQAGEEIFNMLQPQKQNYFEQQGPPVIGPENYKEGLTNIDKLTPFGIQKLRGLMGGVEPTTAQELPVIGPENMDNPGTRQIENPSFTTARQAALEQMRQSGGEMVQPKMDMQKLIGVLARTDPEKAAALQVSLQNTEAKLETQKQLNDIRYEYLKDAFTAKTEHEKELAKMKYENAVKLLEEKYEYMKELKKMPSISIHTGGGESYKPKVERYINKSDGTIRLVDLNYPGTAEYLRQYGHLLIPEKEYYKQQGGGKRSVSGLRPGGGAGTKIIVRTGTDTITGRRVVQYSDGSVEYAK